MQKSLNDPLASQKKVFYRLLQNYKNTKYGKAHQLNHVKDLDSFKQSLPLVNYEDIQPWISRMMEGENDVLVGGAVKYFSKSSGTTNSKSKFIPVPSQNLIGNHFKGSWESLALFYQKRPDALLFNKKSLMIAGTTYTYPEFPDAVIGDISAIMTYNMPAFFRRNYTPSMQTAFMSNWDEKIKKISEEIVGQDIVMFGGVPTWLLVIFKEVLHQTGHKDLLKIWPNLQGYFHGGVGFTPYLKQFQSLIPDSAFVYHEIYNASEGFFGVQDQKHEKGMALLVNNGVFYEFLPTDQWESDNPKTIGLEDVETGKPYALIISANNGLVRYKLGDVIEFSSVFPFRFNIKGRTKHFINVFGEEVMVDNTDKAIAMTCKEFNTGITDYTVAPIFLSAEEKGGHEWLIEFERTPANLESFADRLDFNLRELNSDYDAKRAFDMAMVRLKINALPRGTFNQWMRDRKKLGGQHKVPRLSNHRDFVDEILLGMIGI